MSANSSFNQPMGQPISIHFIPSNLVVSLLRKTVVSFPRNQVVTLQWKKVVTLRGISSYEVAELRFGVHFFKRVTPHLCNFSVGRYQKVDWIVLFTSYQIRFDIGVNIVFNSNLLH
jgi:hypothetical protein